MTGSVNKVILVGNTGNNPEIRSTNDGKEIATFALATSDTWKDKTTDERKERTEWHRVVVFNDALVGIIKNYVKKGSKLYIEGSIHTRKWTDNEGHEKYSTEIVLQNYDSKLVLLDSKKSDAENDHANTNSTKNDDDDIPSS